MNAIAMEFVFSLLTMISYLIFAKSLPMQTMICIYASAILMLLRMLYARKNSLEVRHSRRAMYLWIGIHLSVCIMVAIEDSFLSVILGVVAAIFGGGMFFAILEDTGIDPFENVDPEKVKRWIMYSIGFDTLGLCILDMCKNFKISKVVFTVIITVIIVLYGEMFFPSDEETQDEEKE